MNSIFRFDSTTGAFPLALASAAGFLRAAGAALALASALEGAGLPPTFFSSSAEL